MNYGRFASRLTLGLMFFVIGITKLADPSGTAGFLSNLGFPATTVLAWILIIAEVIGGALLLVGYKAEYAAVPLFVVLLVATLIAQLELPASLSAIGSKLSTGGIWLHFLGMTALYDIYENGAGPVAVET